MKRVLMITYYFPPLGGVGVIRPVQFAKHLRSFGWTPVILTVQDIAYPMKDPDLLLELMDVPIVRTESGDLNRLLWRLGRRTLRVSARARRASLFGPNFWLFPDAKVPWLPFAIRRARAVLREFRPQVLYSVSPPFTTHLIAWLLHDRSQIPWVADFTDPWPTGHHTPSPLHRLLYRRLRTAIANRCTLPVKVYPGIPLGPRAVLLEHGYDPEAFAAGTSDKPRFPGDSLNVLYTGTLDDKGPGIRVFLRALRRVPEAHLWIAGPSSQHVIRWAQEEGVQDQVHDLGFLPHGEIPGLLKAADALWFISPFPTATLKLYEYLGAGRPILIQAPDDSDAMRLARRYPTTFLPVRTSDDIEVALRTLWHRRETRGSPPRELAWPYLTQRLASLLDRISNTPSSPP